MLLKYVGKRTGNGPRIDSRSNPPQKPPCSAGQRCLRLLSWDPQIASAAHRDQRRSHSGRRALSQIGRYFTISDCFHFEWIRGVTVVHRLLRHLSFFFVADVGRIFRCWMNLANFWEGEILDLLLCFWFIVLYIVLFVSSAHLAASYFPVVIFHLLLEYLCLIRHREFHNIEPRRAGLGFVS